MINYLKKKIKKRLFNINIPFFSFLIIKYFSKNNIYVHKKYLTLNLFYKLKKLHGYISFDITGTGVLILFYNKYIIKIPLGDTSLEALEIDYSNYLKIKEMDFKELVDYKLEFKQNYYVMERLNSSNILYDDIEKIFLTLEKNVGTVTIKNIIDNNLINIDILEKVYQIELLMPLDTDIESSVMHGDFTCTNIMKTASNSLVLIDLDRFKINGIKYIDKIHYFIDSKSKKERINFFKCLNDILNNNILKYPIKYIYIYFIYRISNEYRKNIVLNLNYYENVIKINNLFKKRKL